VSTEHRYEVGDWVAITGRIVEVHGNGVDLAVELFSKTDQYKCWIRADLCTPTDKPVPDEPREGSVALVNGVSAYQRRDDYWVQAGFTGGYRWESLHEFGEVQVIHHA
jgi:hypothetical protein